MKKLVLFDVDGTLVVSNEFDISYYFRAIKAVLGLTRVNMDWSQYDKITDVGMLSEIYRGNYNEEIQAETIARVKEYFVGSMRDALKSGNGHLKPLDGISDVLARLNASDEWTVVLATGGWKESAALKLKYAGVELNGIPIFSGNDAKTRSGIIRKAINEKLTSESIGKFDKIVYVGDAIWDLKVSRDLGIAFIGVGEAAQTLLTVGASHAMDDYSDTEAFIQTLETCTIPKAI